MTDEQIEAAARAIHLWDSDDLPADWDKVPPRIKARRREQATAALAAAETWKPVETANEDGPLLVSDPFLFCHTRYCVKGKR